MARDVTDKCRLSRLLGDATAVEVFKSRAGRMPISAKVVWIVSKRPTTHSVGRREVACEIDTRQTVIHHAAAALAMVAVRKCQSLVGLASLKG